MGVRKWSWRLRATLGVVAAMAAVPIGYALAQSEEAESPVPPGFPPAEGHATLSDIQKGSDYGSLNKIGTSLPPRLVESCEAQRADPSNDCGLVLAFTDGKLQPGLYTDAELEAAVAEAGYSWVAAPDGGQP